jgi:prolyl oligopeptidase
MAETGRLPYPRPPRAEFAETLHGVVVRDPFRPLEDPNSPAVRAWVAEQNRLSAAALGSSPERAALRRRLGELWNYERRGLPVRRGAHWFFQRHDGLAAQPVLYVAESPAGPGRPLIDPNTLAADGTTAAAGFAISRDGAFVAYGLARAGSDRQEWRVRETATGRDRPDVVRRVKFSEPAWSVDGSGFYYSRYDAAPDARDDDVDRNQKLCFHRLGDPQEADRVVYERPDRPDWGFGATPTPDGRHLVTTIWNGAAPENALLLLDLATPDARPTPLTPECDARYDYVACDGDEFLLVTDRDAPRGKVIAVDRRRPEPSAWRLVVPEAEEALAAATFVGGRLFASYLQDARSTVRTFDRRGAPGDPVPLPALGTAAGFGGEPDDAETFFSFAGYARPAELYRYEIATGAVSPLFRPEVAFAPEAFVTERLRARSRDGTSVPMFVVRRRDVPFDGERPTYLYGYGGFNVSLTPTFSPAHVAWLEAGGVYVEANLRGGGEFGEDWHRGGVKLAKQNVIDDFRACAEELMRAGVTRPGRLALGGHSNGGLLVGAAITQYPELFAAAVCGVGVLDLVRFPRFTIGRAWIPEYGSPEDPTEFAALYALSPLHRVREGVRYPAVLITTADHDDRVVPAHSYKFAAALQEAQAVDGPPILVRIDVAAGHGGGKPTAKQIDEWTDVWTFLRLALKAP